MELIPSGNARSFPFHLLAELAQVGQQAPLDRKLLVASTRGEGREILRALVRHTGEWIGFEVTTPRPLALVLAEPLLALEGVDLLDEFAEQALFEEALDEVLARQAGSFVAELGEGVGFRRAARGAVQALRLAGVRPTKMESAFEDRSKGSLVARLLSAFESRLQGGGCTDTAGVLARATASLEDGCPLPADRVLLLPALTSRGLSGRFLRALQVRGAMSVRGDPIHGLRTPRGLLWQEAPTAGSRLAFLYQDGAAVTPGVAPAGTPNNGTLDLFARPAAEAELPLPQMSIFHAAGVTEELREILRRILERGLNWDEVEIVTPDPANYGPALHALGSRLGIPVTFAVGLPVERTRPGRALRRYLAWIEGGFPSAALRRLLETEDLGPPPGYRELDGNALARKLRELRIGWGRDRYLPAVDRALAQLERAPSRARKDETEKQRERRTTRARRELEALRALLAPILEATPQVPGQAEDTAPSVSPAALAGGMRVFLGQVAPGGPVDRTAVERLGTRLDRVAAALVRPTAFSSAMAIVTAELGIRVPAPRSEGRAPWSSAGGHLHLADVEHGGFTGRQATFLAGLDASRFPGGGEQDPFLLDRERRALARDSLPTSTDRLDERRFRMAALLSRVRGSLTLSYTAWEASEGRVLTPSPLLLQAYRLMRGETTLGYEALLDHLGPPESRIPAGRVYLDREDVWLGALAREGRLLEGEHEVRTAFRGIAGGLTAASARRAESPGEYHGLVGAKPELDPRLTGETLSASRLEMIGKCPLRFFYRHVLRVRPFEDPSFDPDRWLDPLRRGGLLHGVFERTLREAQARGIDYAEEAFEEMLIEVLHEETEEARREVPPPSEAVYGRELLDLVEDVHSFLGMMRRERPHWIELEMTFGLATSDRGTVSLTLPGGGTLRLRGAIDRVDRVQGGLRVVDYKTGTPRHYQPATGTWHGGRRLQNGLYTEVAEALLNERVRVMEYHFPTRRGENRRQAFRRDRLTDALAVVDVLLDIAASGRFLPTENREDCRFCEFRDVCRVREKPWDLESPPAAWARERQDDPAYALFRQVREWEKVRR